MPSSADDDFEPPAGFWPPSDPDLDFPLRDTIHDFAGRRREFLVTCVERDSGFFLRAEEEGKDGMGYQFSATHPVSPYLALGHLRQRMRRALATRHLVGSRDSYELLDDRVDGWITVDDRGNPAFVVDGSPLSLEELAKVMRTYEGWQFRIDFFDPSDDVPR